MDDAVKRMLKTFEAMTEAQRKEFLGHAQDRLKKGYLEESTRKEIGVVMGPLGGSCPYCGK